MTAIAEHRVEMHRITTTRRAQGKPPWEYTLTGFRNTLDEYDRDNPTDDNIREVRDNLVAIIKSSRWYAGTHEFSDLHQLIVELESLADPEVHPIDSDYDPEEHMNWLLNGLYDLADYARVWLS